MTKVNHEERWESIRSIGLTATAEKLGVTKGALRHTVNKFKEWYPDLPFDGGIEGTTEGVTEGVSGEVKKKRTKKVAVESPVVTQEPEISNDLPKGDTDVHVDEKTGEITPVVDGNVVVEKSTDPDIVRYTNEEDDSRFYWHRTKVNTRTGNHFFGSFSFLHGMGAPTSYHLIEWYKNQGHNAERIFKQREIEGSFVHDCCDRMVSKGEEIPTDEIDKRFGDSAKFIKNCLLGFLAFWEEQQPQVISTEMMIVGDDYAGTTDLQCRIKEDNYSKTWLIDYKTSKSVYDHHRVQLVAYNEIVKADEVAILLLGAQNKKKYTLSKINAKDKVEMAVQWHAIKELAYVYIMQEGLIEPKQNIYPPAFKIERHG